LPVHLRRALLAASTALVVAGGVGATAEGLSGGGALPPTSSPQYSTRAPLSDSDSQALTQVMAAAKAGDAARIRVAMATLSDPIARKLALYALIDVDPTGMSYAELDGARRDLADWPHAARRAAATEKVIENGGLRPQSVIDWFAGADPATPEGAMALAAAYQATGQAPKAAAVIRTTWRTEAFDADAQRQMLARFGSVLTADDHAAREDMLLYGAQGPAARDMLNLVTGDAKILAQARMALRSGVGAGAVLDAVPASLQNTPGLAFERAFAAARGGDTATAIALIPSLPTTISDPDTQSRMWKLRQSLVLAALKAQNYRGAYNAAAHSGLSSGEPAADAEFYAGWLALSKLRDPHTADEHFARLQSIGTSPLTQSRALYWRGRANEAEGDTVNAQIFYAAAARYQTTFYGQLAAAKTGLTQISLGSDPQINAADRSRFEDREPVRAARLLANIGAKDSFKLLVMAIAETLPTCAEEAMLVDLVRGYGDQELSMRVVRKAAQRGFIMPGRGYPLRTPPTVANAPEAAFVLGITRQESGFDPRVRSSAGAQGMMQLMPGTAAILARKMGYSYGAGRLDDPDYNMELGSAYLGQLVGQFSGSYIMAAAGYNAGPGRPVEWTSYCGDPRSSSTDPADYIECIPFSETRNYVMRVLENTQVYRARLAGGSAPLTLATDLKRGAYGGGGSGGYGYVAGAPQSVQAVNTQTPPP